MEHNCPVHNEGEVTLWIQLGLLVTHLGKKSLEVQSCFLWGDKFQMTHNYYKNESIKINNRKHMIFLITFWIGITYANIKVSLIVIKERSTTSECPKF